MRKHVLGVYDQVLPSDTNGAVQSHKIARGLKFLIQEVEGLCYLCSENKTLFSYGVTMQLFCAFVSIIQKTGFLMMHLKQFLQVLQKTYVVGAY